MGFANEEEKVMSTEMVKHTPAWKIGLMMVFFIGGTFAVTAVGVRYLPSSSNEVCQDHIAAQNAELTAKNELLAQKNATIQDLESKLEQAVTDKVMAEAKARLCQIGFQVHQTNSHSESFREQVQCEIAKANVAGRLASMQRCHCPTAPQELW